jgi:hypothetical protein
MISEMAGLAKHQARMQMEDSLRMGHATSNDVQAFYRKGQLSQQAAMDIVANGKEKSLEARFERLGMKDALSAYGHHVQRASRLATGADEETCSVPERYVQHPFVFGNTNGPDDSQALDVRSATAISI